MSRILSALMGMVAIGSGIIIAYMLNQVPEKPKMDFDKWWGIGSKPREEDKTIRIFNVEFNDTMIHDLKYRLRNRKAFTKPLEGVQSEYGINTIYLEKILLHWLDKYDFKKRVEYLNKFPHFKTRIQGLDIHYIRIKPNLQNKDINKTVLPLLLLHGWPSSSREFYKIIPALTSPKEKYDFIFEVIAADLPGFGFSEGTNKPGLNSAQMGVIMRNLMKRLGFHKFYIQAGDWGSQCATHMSTLFPDEVLGFHTNMPISSMSVSLFKLFIGALMPRLIVEREYMNRIYPLKKTFLFLLKESGYFHIQATKPDTIGVALTDSPSGLAAYIMEKMAVCSNKDQLNTDHGGLENLPLEDVLDTITISWANSNIVTSMRIYAESLSTSSSEINILHRIPTKVPTAAINFQYEVIYQPNWILRDKFHNLIRSTTKNIGGHFAAMQTPQLLIDDIFESTVEFLKFRSKQMKTK